MKGKIKFLLCGSLVAATLVTPYSFNMNNIKSTVSANSNPVSKAVENVIFVTKDHSKTQEIVNRITTKKNDDSVKKIGKQINEKSLNVKSIGIQEALKKKNSKSKRIITSELIVQSDDNNSSYAIKADEIENNQELQEFANEALLDGDRVYLYGEVTKENFKNLVSVKDAKVPFQTFDGQTAYGDVLIDEATIEKEKGQKKKVDTGIDTYSVDTENIIGLSLDKDSEHQYVEINVSTYNEKGELIENPEENLIQEIVSLNSTIVEEEKQEIASNSVEQQGLFLNNNVSADSSRVKSGYDYIASAYASSTKKGTVSTDYILYKANNDDDSKYDYFTLKPMSQITEYNGGNSKYMKADIDIPYDSDSLEDWDPHGTQNDSDYSMTFGFPWNISWTGSWTDATKIVDISSRALDYARWEVTDGDLNHQDFRPGATWRSAGTMASVGYKVWANFYEGANDQYKTTAYDSISIRFDY
ncbi:MAG: hypothetical protein E6778_12755 [Niallia nealsonii]|nr:hypothetical protein [Niallia nealsonii]